MNADDERDIDPVEHMMRIAQDFLLLPAWDFKESFRSIKPASLIYDSEHCRIKLIWGDGSIMTSATLSYLTYAGPTCGSNIDSFARVYDIAGRSPAIKPSLDKVC